MAHRKPVAGPAGVGVPDATKGAPNTTDCSNAYPNLSWPECPRVQVSVSGSSPANVATRGLPRSANRRHTKGARHGIVSQKVSIGCRYRRQHPWARAWPWHRDIRRGFHHHDYHPGELQYPHAFDHHAHDAVSAPLEQRFELLRHYDRVIPSTGPDLLVQIHHRHGASTSCLTGALTRRSAPRRAPVVGDLPRWAESLQGGCVRPPASATPPPPQRQRANRRHTRPSCWGSHGRATPE